MPHFVTEILWMDGSGDGGDAYATESEAVQACAASIAADPTIERCYIAEHTDAGAYVGVVRVLSGQARPACTCGPDHDCRSTGCDDDCPRCNGERI